jgi:hypothetical protein
VAGLVEGRWFDALPAADDIEHASPGNDIWQRA